ncbi:hypothetical protein Zm00014a_043315, partial [Zea mays]
TPLALAPSPICALADPSSTSPSLRARQSTAATNPRRPEPVSRPPLELRRVRCHGELRPGVRNPGRASIPFPPPYFSLPALTRCSPCSRGGPPPSRHCRRRGIPGARLEVKNLSRPYRPVYCLLPCVIPRRSRFMPPPSRSAVGRPPPVPLPRPRPHQRTPRALPNLPGHPGRPRGPPNARAPRLRRALRREDERRRPS